MVAKRFFYVCAGILCLALAYHLGAVTATAQAPSGYECVGFDNVNGAAVINHELWLAENGTEVIVRTFGGPIPNPARAVACGQSGVVLENGQVWRNNQGYWQYAGTLPFSGTVSATQETWGSVKARYRPGASAAPQDK